MKWIKRLFCKHEYEFLRNIYGDEINYCGGYRSIWRCKKCGALEYRDKLNLSLKETLNNNYKQYYTNKYNNWIKQHKNTLDNMTNTMMKNSKEGLCWANFILICDANTNDKYYYEKWFNSNKLEVNNIELYHQQDTPYELNQYQFSVRWD